MVNTIDSIVPLFYSNSPTNKRHINNIFRFIEFNWMVRYIFYDFFIISEKHRIEEVEQRQQHQLWHKNLHIKQKYRSEWACSFSYTKEIMHECLYKNTYFDFQSVVCSHSRCMICFCLLCSVCPFLLICYLIFDCFIPYFATDFFFASFIHGNLPNHSSIMNLKQIDRWKLSNNFIKWIPFWIYIFFDLFSFFNLFNIKLILFFFWYRGLTNFLGGSH